MRVERNTLGLVNMYRGDVVITSDDCYMISLGMDKLISLHTGSILTVEGDSIQGTIQSFGENILEVIPNNELVIRRDV